MVLGLLWRPAVHSIKYSVRGAPRIGHLWAVPTAVSSVRSAFAGHGQRIWAGHRTQMDEVGAAAVATAIERTGLFRAPEPTVVVPTFCEHGNVQRLIKRIDDVCVTFIGRLFSSTTIRPQPWSNPSAIHGGDNIAPDPIESRRVRQRASFGRPRKKRLK